MTPKNRDVLLFTVFLVLITGLTLVYHYPDTIMKRPQSVHNWRQCDGASIALNYYQEGMHFFRPQTHMLYSDNHTTGYSAPSEIPILYYFVAILYKIFGYHEFLFRGLNLLIFYIGLFYLFRLADAVLKDMFYATVAMVLIFSAPVLVYYANNYMPNTAALSFSFIGWYYFYAYYKNGLTRTFLFSMLFFGIACAMKVTELTGPVILLILLIGDRVGIIRTGIHSTKDQGLKLASILAIFVLVGGWILYARHYNQLHQSNQFSTYTFPIWGMDREAIDFTFHKVKVIWFRDYFYPATFWFMTGSLVILILLWKRSENILRWICIFQVLALAAFSMLWYYALGDHDYFYISFYVLPAFLFINLFLIITNQEFSKLNAVVLKFVFVAAMIINVYYARERHTLRYYGSWMNDYEQQKDLYTIPAWLRESEITKNDTVIFYPGIYIRPLYLMNVKGWTIPDQNPADRDTQKRDSLLLQKFISNGAEYFITNNIKSAIAYKPFEPFMKDLYTKYKSVFIFRLPPLENNFNPTDSTLINY